METKDYDICENRLHEIDKDVFPIIIPSLRSIELTVENDVELDIFGQRVEPCMGKPRRIQQIAPPTPEDPTTTEYHQETTDDENTQHTPTEDDDRLTVRIIAPPGNTDENLTMRPSTLMCCIMAKILQKYDKKQSEITHLAIPRNYGEYLIPCNIHATAMELGLTHGDRVKLILQNGKTNVA
ncbi:hypothetical protein V5O48_005219 [Marasmius crinis-equi]|uniref:Uncharacterized protein n=1 Tax=Marasmius crinis-equi TaxID=585013 RepID=A0ABR3FN33_9AGAR